MRTGILTACAALGLVAAACTGGPNDGRSSLPPDDDPYDESPTAVIANAVIADASGKILGLATFRETRLGVKVDLKVTGFPSGTHGTHVHAVGKCEGPDFTSAGGHVNVNGKRHGVPGAVTAHAGDMPNLEVSADGKGQLVFYSPHLSLNKAASNGLTFGAGTAVVIHQNADDQRTDPAGNSGARIACGVVKVATAP